MIDWEGIKIEISLFSAATYARGWHILPSNFRPRGNLLRAPWKGWFHIFSINSIL